MIQSRATIGASLLCAFALCAFAAPGASAKGTTAFKCVGGAGALDFKDAHCDNEVTAGTGSFGHVSLGTEAVSIEVTNAGTKTETTESTPGVFNATVAGLAVEIICAKAVGSSTNKNTEIGGVMQNVGEKLTLKFTECVVLKPANCKLSGNEINVTSGATSLTVENIKGTEMGVQFSPEGSKPFAELKFLTMNEKEKACPLAGKNANILGVVTGTGPRPSTELTSSRGATVVITKEMTEEELEVAGTSASVSVALTVKSAGTPVTLTTTSP